MLLRAPCYYFLLLAAAGAESGTACSEECEAKFLTGCADHRCESGEGEGGPRGLQTMLQKLQLERARVAARFNPSALQQHLVRGAGAPAALGARLTAAALTGRPYVVGVTGGSATAGHNSWPTMLQAWLRSTAVGVPGAVVRNAGQGTTSQLVTSPCIRALVGDHVDLLLWEFAMNDEYGGAAGIANDAPPDFPVRRRVAEAYVRQAAQLAPGALGFVHLWDLDIHGYNATTDNDVPNKAFAPTNAVAAAYAPVFDRYFAMDTIGAMQASGLYSTKLDFLRDHHHPNEFGYGVITDLLALSILQPWIHYLKGGGKGLPAPPPAGPSSRAGYDLAASSVRNHHMITPPRDDLFLPGKHTLAHCYMAMPPNFGNRSAGVLQFSDQNISRVNVGRSDPERDDRQMRFKAFECKGSGAKNNNITGGVLFTAAVRRIAAVLVDCGYNRGKYCIGALRLFLDGKEIKPTTKGMSVNSDILAGFYQWAHKTSEPVALATHSLRVCAQKEDVIFSRLVVLEEL